MCGPASQTDTEEDFQLQAWSQYIASQTAHTPRTTPAHADTNADADADADADLDRIGHPRALTRSQSAPEHAPALASSRRTNATDDSGGEEGGVIAVTPAAAAAAAAAPLEWVRLPARARSWSPGPDVFSLAQHKAEEFDRLMRGGVPDEHRVVVWRHLIDNHVKPERIAHGPNYYAAISNVSPDAGFNDTPSKTRVRPTTLFPPHTRFSLPVTHHYDSSHPLQFTYDSSLCLITPASVYRELEKIY